MVATTIPRSSTWPDRVVEIQQPIPAPVAEVVRLLRERLEPGLADADPVPAGVVVSAVLRAEA